MSQAWTGRWAPACGAEQAGDPNHEATLLNTQLPRPLLSLCGCGITVLPLGRGMWPAGVPDTRLGLVASWPHTPKPTSRGLEDPGASFPRTPHGCGVTRGPGTSARPQTHTAACTRSEGLCSVLPAFQGQRQRLSWSHGEYDPEPSGDPSEPQATDGQVPAQLTGCSCWKRHPRLEARSPDKQGLQPPAPGFGTHLCWHFLGRVPGRPRAWLRLQGRPRSHGKGSAGMPPPARACNVNIGNFLGIPRELTRGETGLTPARGSEPGCPGFLHQPRQKGAARCKAPEAPGPVLIFGCAPGSRESRRPGSGAAGRGRPPTAADTAGSPGPPHHRQGRVSLTAASQRRALPCPHGCR